MAEAADSATKTSLKDLIDPGDKLLTAVQWVLSALGVVAGAAVTKVAADRLNNGDYGDWRLFWVLAASAAFAIGVAALVSAVVSAITISSAGLSWLLNAKKPGSRGEPWRWMSVHLFGRDPYLAWETIESLGSSPYLLPSTTWITQPPLTDANESESKRRLRAFLSDLDRLVQAQFAYPTDFISKPIKTMQLAAALKARGELLEIVKRIRRHGVTRALPYRFVAGTLAATLGAVVFLLVTADAQRVQDRIDHARARAEQKVVTGELLPKTPSQVTIIGDSCRDSRAGTLLEIAPHGNESTSVMHVYLPKTEHCRAKTAWYPPERVIPAQTTTTTTAAKVATTTTTAAAGD